MPLRTITFLSVIQVMALTVCCLLVGWFLEFYKDIMVFEGVNRAWTNKMRAVHSLRFLIILLPVGGGLLCAALSATHRDIAWLKPSGFVLAIVFTLIAVFFSVVTGAAAISGPPVPFRYYAL